MITPAAIKPGDARSAGQRNSKHSALLSKQMGWMDGWYAILRPFQQCFSHIRTMGADDDERICSMKPRLKARTR